MHQDFHHLEWQRDPDFHQIEWQHDGASLHEAKASHCKCPHRHSKAQKDKGRTIKHDTHMTVASSEGSTEHGASSRDGCEAARQYTPSWIKQGQMRSSQSSNGIKHDICIHMHSHRRRR
jgi:hypothetical protein